MTFRFVAAGSCEACDFDFSGALTSLYVMLIVLLSVLTPMLIVILVVFLMRFCCSKRKHQPATKKRISLDRPQLTQSMTGKALIESALVDDLYRPAHQVIIEIPPCGESSRPLKSYPYN